MSLFRRSYRLEAQQGEALWFFGGLATVKASSEQTDGRFSLTEQLLPGGQATPLHSQPEDDETFYVLEGDLTFYLGDGKSLAASAGAVVHVPKGTAHAYRVDSEIARVLNITTPQHESFFRAAGEPAPARELPPQGPPDIDRIMSAANEYGVEILGPHPAPPLSEGPIRPIKELLRGHPMSRSARLLRVSETTGRPPPESALDSS